MAKTKVQKAHHKARGAFPDQVDARFKEKFGIESETEFNIFSMRLVTRRTDEQNLTSEQAQWLEGYSNGYHDALDNFGTPQP